MTVPEVGVSRQPIMFKTVVLPLPDGPTMAKNSPCATARLTPRSASTATFPSRYCFQTCCILTRGDSTARLLYPLCRDRRTGTVRGVGGGCLHPWRDCVGVEIG